MKYQLLYVLLGLFFINFTNLHAQKGHYYTLETALAAAQEVRTLDLNEQQLTELPAELAQCTNLKTLRLEGNKIRQLPEEWSALPNLRVLQLGDNQLTIFPKALANFKQLEVLELQDNKLTQLPAEFCFYIGQITLDLSNNALIDLPQNCGLDQYLNASLDLRGNAFSAEKRAAFHHYYTATSNTGRLFLED